MAKGWHREPGRHALAAKGVPTGRKMNIIAKPISSDLPKEPKYYYKNEPVDVLFYSKDKSTVFVRPWDDKDDIEIWSDDLQKIDRKSEIEGAERVYVGPYEYVKAKKVPRNYNDLTTTRGVTKLPAADMEKMVYVTRRLDDDIYRSPKGELFVTNAKDSKQFYNPLHWFRLYKQIGDY